MAHFNFTLQDFASGKNIASAVMFNSINITPTGKAQALRTSESIGEPKKSLTTFNVSDILQGATTYKPEALVYNSFNNMLSKDLSFSRNTTAGGSRLNFGKSQIGLMGYDTERGKGIEIGINSSANNSSILRSASSGTASNNPITIEGQPPAGIPRGPFTASIKRHSNSDWITDTGVQEISLDPRQIIDLLLAASCDLNGAVFMWAVAKRESGFICNRAGINDNGTIDAGIWQINNGIEKRNGIENKIYDGWRGYSFEQVLDPWVNVTLAMKLSNNGTRFVPWQTSGDYQNPDGSHLKSVNMEEAINFFRENGFRV
jgi:hypothetical protein